MDLSVVIVEYKSAGPTAECVASLNEHLGFPDWECIVVSNSEYSEVRLKELQTRLPGARVIRNDRNRGYAGGVNRALPETRAPFVLVLNPDCRLVDHSVRDLLDVLRRDPTVALAAPRLVNEAGVLEDSCRRFPRPWTFLLVRTPLRRFQAARREKRRYLMEDADHSVLQDVDWVFGAAMLVRKEAVSHVGPMDERYFLYMEDVDWCRRFWRAGWKVVYCPHCTILHEGQHVSTRGSFRSLGSRHFWIHLSSLTKYSLKWS